MITSIIKGLAKIQGDIEPFVTHKGGVRPPLFEGLPPRLFTGLAADTFSPPFFTLRYFRSTPLQTA